MLNVCIKLLPLDIMLRFMFWWCSFELFLLCYCCLCCDMMYLFPLISMYPSFQWQFNVVILLWRLVNCSLDDKSSNVRDYCLYYADMITFKLCSSISLAYSSLQFANCISLLQACFISFMHINFYWTKKMINLLSLFYVFKLFKCKH